MRQRKVHFYGLEAELKPDYSRAVHIRREFVKDYIYSNNDRAKVPFMDKVPHEHYDWSNVVGSNCENVIGYVPIPVGFAGPVLMDGSEHPIPMATTEGALVASTHRGARAVSQSGGCTTRVTADGMTRSPVVAMPSLARAVELQRWCEKNFVQLQAQFNSTTRFGRLDALKIVIVGRKVYMRFRSVTGDAMGMNMVTKGVQKVLDFLKDVFPDLQVISVSGNYCTDKKPSAINWVEGRGKSVCAEAIINHDTIEKVLKTNIDSLISLNIDKNFVGSAMAGSVGGFNAHAANVVAAIFLATGQDPAQVVESCTCLTYMEKVDAGLLVAVTMPSIEVGTVGGGTALPAQRAILDMMGCGGANAAEPGKNAQTLARLVAAAVLCAELSILSAQAAGHLVSAHLRLNRK
jgi:hydroxymethylglutaryl-CoA reductase (NADPH)